MTKTKAVKSAKKTAKPAVKKAVKKTVKKVAKKAVVKVAKKKDLKAECVRILKEIYVFLQKLNEQDREYITKTLTDLKAKLTNKKA